jgi:Arc/MetJ family transcription regulator
LVRTNLDIDDALLALAMTATGLPTKEATVEEALRRLVETERRRDAIKTLAGLGWEGDLDEMRRNSFRSFDE